MTTRKIREAIVADPAAWKKAAYGKRFTDLFSLGTVLYEMVTGRKAFTGDSTAAAGNANRAFCGEHQVFAVLRDPGNRRVLATETVTFFVKQHSVNFNRPVATPRN